MFRSYDHHQGAIYSLLKSRVIRNEAQNAHT